MDCSHVAIAVLGAVLGVWFRGAPPKPDIPICHCQCNIPQVERSNNGDPWTWITVLGCFLLLVGANLALAFRVTIRQNLEGEKEFTFSVKGKQGKGIYGATRGLQILDR